jgi:alpha/beta superfamily hydrolase
VLASALGADRAPSNGTADVEIAAPVPSALEVGGFPISAATLSALALIDLNARIPAVSEMLVIDGANQITSRSWAEQASRSGIRAQHCALSGLVEMIMTAPQFASVPTEMVAAMRDWLQQYPVGIAETAGATGRHRINAQGLHSPAMYLACTGLPDHGSLRERPVFLTSEALLFGIVTEPSQEERRHRAVILLNAGADYHIGASGMYVGLARHWAQLGYVVLRMDLGGLGDSATRPGRPNDEIFPPAALDDIRNAIEWMRNRYSVSEMTLAGVCSGAYHALQAAIAAVPVDRILMVNPENFFWNEGMTVRDMQMAELVRNPTVYRERMFSSAAWKKLTSGRVNIRYILKIYLYRALLAIESTLRDLARYLRIHLPRDLGWDLERIGKRGVRLVFVFARGEPGIELLTLLAGMSVKRLGARCRVHIIDSADHVFSKSGPRTILERILSDELCSPVERSGRRRIGLQTQPKTL